MKESRFLESQIIAILIRPKPAHLCRRITQDPAQEARDSNPSLIKLDDCRLE